MYLQLLECYKQHYYIHIHIREVMSKLFCQSDTRHRDDYEDFMNNIEPCQIHNRPTQFICLNRQCQQHLMLCVQCVTDHRDHNFQKIDKFFCRQKFDRIKQGQGRKHKHFDDMADLVKTKMNEIQQTVCRKLEEIKHRIDLSMDRFKNLGIKMTDINQKIDQHMMLLIKSYLEEQWSFIRCEKMKQTFDKVLNQIQDSFVNLAEDLLEFIQDEDWENIEEREFKHVEEEWFVHLHPHIEKVVEYFKFDPDQKASNIKLVKERLQAEYLRSTPSCPFVLCDNYIKEDKTQWIIHVKECDSKMVFFNASTIYIGVCRPDIVKRMAYSKVNEGGRGTYLIGSNGWSYHHTDPSLDRQDIVGFTFGKGDKIHVEVDLRGRGKIKFKKNGKLFDSKFEMPLNIDEKMLSRPYLKPCVGFSDDVGVTVRIINLSKKDKLASKQKR